MRRTDLIAPALIAGGGVLRLIAMYSGLDRFGDQWPWWLSNVFAPIGLGILMAVGVGPMAERRVTGAFASGLALIIFTFGLSNILDDYYSTSWQDYVTLLAGLMMLGGGVFGVTEAKHPRELINPFRNIGTGVASAFDPNRGIPPALAAADPNVAPWNPSQGSPPGAAPLRCPNGHEVSSSQEFCPFCGLELSSEGYPTADPAIPETDT